MTPAVHLTLIALFFTAGHVRKVDGVQQPLQCNLQDATCPTRICPNYTSVVYSCNLPPVSLQLGYTRWNIPEKSCSIALLQPIISSGCYLFNYAKQCGQFTAIQSCNMTFLQFTVNNSLNGTIIHCQNWNITDGKVEELGNATIRLTADSKTVPGFPTPHLQPSSTSVSVSWSTSFTGDPAYWHSVRIRGQMTTQTATTDADSNIVNFSGLDSNTLYTITITAVNCAGSAEVNTTVYTLPDPPSGTLAICSTSSSNNARIFALWNQKLQKNNSTQTYTCALRINGVLFNNNVVSCDDYKCYCYVDISTISTPPPYAVEVAAISNGQMSSYSQPVKSVASSSSNIYVMSSIQYNFTNVACIFLDGTSHQCLICCQYEPKGPYILSMLTSTSGVWTSGVFGNLKQGHTYSCISSPGDQSSHCGGVNTISSVQFTISTLPAIYIVLGAAIDAKLISQDPNHATVQCTFYDGHSQYCLICCSTDPSVQAYTYNNVSSSNGTFVNVDLYGLQLGAVYYCKASPADTITASCHTSEYLSPPSLYIAVGVSISATFVIFFSLGVFVTSVLTYISRRSKEPSHKPSLHADSGTVYEEVVDTNKKKETVIMKKNNAYVSHNS